MNIKDNNITDLNDFVKKLESYRTKLINIDYIHNKQEFFNIIKDLRQYLTSVDNDELYNTFLHSKYYNFYKDYFTQANLYYLRSIESVQALSIMTQGIHNFESFTDLIDKDVIKQSFNSKWKEIKSLDFSKAKNLVMIWSWPFPETLLYIAENTDIEHIIWIDYNHEAIFISWEMISWLNEDKITFVQCNWTEYNFSETDIVYMPLFTYPKEQILEKIVETWKDSIQILITVPKWLWNLLFEGISYIPNRLKIVSRETVKTVFTNYEVIKLEIYNF